MPPKLSTTRIALDDVGKTLGDMVSGFGDRKAQRPADANPNAVVVVTSDPSSDLPDKGMAAINARKKPGGYNPGSDADELTK